MADASATALDETSPLSGLKATLGPDLLHQLQHCKIWLVGAGGIGCELLKNLALIGARNVTVTDLDTIDVSNLNRQLLFRAPHVGQPKCSVACQVAEPMVVVDTDDGAAKNQTTRTSENNEAKKQETDGGAKDDGSTRSIAYTPLHGNVCDTSQFHVKFVEQFDVVLNALDNVTARRRVNRLCLAAHVPLIEAGTTGYLGQVNVIYKQQASDDADDSQQQQQQVACYECVSQEPPKVYPICTIRSTPSAPVHTIVWAKECFKLLFGSPVQESMLYEGDDTEGGDNTTTTTTENSTGGSGEPSTYMDAVLALRQSIADSRSSSSNSDSSSTVEAAARNVIQALCVTEIQKQLDMDRYKTAQKVPQVLAEADWKNADASSSGSSSSSTTAVWTPSQAVQQWIACCVQAANSTKATSFDKDDDWSMRFVAAASNLRSHIFGIECQSLYSCKGIAGNIIPAIATTNAICAGLQILQMIHILRAKLEKSTAPDDGNNNKAITSECRYINCLRNCTRNGLYLTARPLEKPNPKCAVCQTATLPLTLNTQLYTLQDLLDKIVLKELGFEQPTILLNEGDCMVWEQGDGADTANFEVNLNKKLADLPGGGITNGTVFMIEDFTQDLEMAVAVTHCQEWELQDGEDETTDHSYKYVLSSKPPSATKKATSATAASSGSNQVDDDDDSVVVEVTTTTTGKRPAAESLEESSSSSNAKKRKTGSDDEIVVLD